MPDGMVVGHPLQRIVFEEPPHQVAEATIKWFAAATGLSIDEAAVIDVFAQQVLFAALEPGRLVAAEVDDRRLKQLRAQPSDPILGQIAAAPDVEHLPGERHLLEE